MPKESVVCRCSSCGPLGRKRQIYTWNRHKDKDKDHHATYPNEYTKESIDRNEQLIQYGVADPGRLSTNSYKGISDISRVKENRSAEKTSKLQAKLLPPPKLLKNVVANVKHHHVSKLRPRAVPTRAETPPEEQPIKASLRGLYEVLLPLHVDYTPDISSERGYPINLRQHEREIANEIIRRHGIQDLEVLSQWPRWGIISYLQYGNLKTTISSLADGSPTRFIQFENLNDNRKMGYAEVIWFSEFRYDDGIMRKSPTSTDTRDLITCYCRLYNALELFQGFVKIARSDAFVAFPVNWISHPIDLIPVRDHCGNIATNHFWVNRQGV